MEVLDSIRFQDKNKLKEQFAIDILTGFLDEKKHIKSKYFYDDEGSRLFSKIMELEEYYPSDCEFEIFQDNKEEISQLMKDRHFNLIELGAGDGRKTKILLEQFLKNDLDFEYIFIDISEAAVEELDEKLNKELPTLKHTGIVGEYLEAITWINENREAQKVVLFLGSNIGNFSRAAALVFLRTLWGYLNDKDSLLIGFDLKKDIKVLTQAYNDSDGVTRDFNLNVLQRINNELGANFDLSKFMHHEFYNPNTGAMESYLISKEEQEVQIQHLEKTFHFNAFEPIHLEYSNKFLPQEMEDFAKKTGYKVTKNFLDQRKYFSDSLWSVEKENL